MIAYDSLTTREVSGVTTLQGGSLVVPAGETVVVEVTTDIVNETSGSVLSGGDTLVEVSFEVEKELGSGADDVQIDKITLDQAAKTSLGSNASDFIYNLSLGQFNLLILYPTLVSFDKLSIPPFGSKHSVENAADVAISSGYGSLKSLAQFSIEETGTDTGIFTPNFGLANDDTVTGSVDDSDTIVGGTFGTDANDTINFDIDVHIENDTINAGLGDDLVTWTVSADGSSLIPTDKIFAINLGEGADTVVGGVAIEFSKGGTGNDVISGGGGADTLNGNEGNDSVTGGDGNERNRGGMGDDTVSGGAGQNIIQGDKGDDLLFGTGLSFSLATENWFKFRLGDGVDIIRDFNTSTDQLSIEGFTAEEILSFALQDGLNVKIAYGTGDEITIENTDLADLTIELFPTF